MSHTAIALRRIIKSIGSPAVSRSSRRDVPSVVRCLQTKSTYAHEQSYIPFIRRTNIKPSAATEDRVLAALLSRIREHLGETSRSQESPQENVIETEDTESPMQASLEVAEDYDQEAQTSQLSPVEQDVDREEADSDEGAYKQEIFVSYYRQDATMATPASEVQTHITTEGVSDTIVFEPDFQSSSQDARDQEPPGRRSRLAHRLATKPKATDPAIVEQEAVRRAALDAIAGSEIPFKYPMWSKEAQQETAEARRQRRQRRIDHFQKRHDLERFPVLNEWQSALTILKSITSREPQAYVKKRQKYTLPTGHRLKWTTDSGEAILILYNSTGSHLQTAQSPEGATIMTFTGTASQNISARRSIIKHNVFEIEGPERRNLSAQEFLESEDYGPIETIANQSSHDDSVVRTVWSTTSLRTDIRAYLVKAVDKGIVLPSLQLSAAVMHLVDTRPQDATLQRMNTESSADTVAVTLGKLLSNPDNIPNTEADALRAACQYLAVRGHFPIVRQILRSHDDYRAKHPSSMSQVSIDVMTPLLAAAAKNMDIHNMRFLLLNILGRGLQADFKTWLSFFRITQELLPEKSQQILHEMKDYGMLEDTAFDVHVHDLEIAGQLQTALAAVADPSEKLSSNFIPDFIDHINQLSGSSRWITPSNASKLIKILLHDNHWDAALQVVELLIEDWARVPMHILHHFLQVANREGHENAQLAVHVLKIFPPLLERRNVESHDSIRDIQTNLDLAHRINTTFGRRQTINAQRIYLVLFNIALKTYSWNLLRVVWQHACCAGQVDIRIRQWMHHSLRLRMSSSWDELKNASQFRLWQRTFALFAIGIGGAPRTSRKVARQSQIGLDRLVRDMNAYGVVRPMNSLADDAIAAYKLDLQWIKGNTRTVEKTCSGMKVGLWPFNDISDPAALGIVVPVTHTQRLVATPDEVEQTKKQ